ncbi:MAG: hypothetical protein ACP5J6_00325 [Candidatus Saccharicenans sp.]
MSAGSEINKNSFFLPQYLFQLWEERRTGKLIINPGPYEKVFCLVKGELTAVKKYFPEQDFLNWLIEIKKIHPPLRLNRQLLGSEEIKSALAVLIEHGFLPAAEAFELVNNFLAARLTDYFPLMESTGEFEEENFKKEEIILKGIFTPAVVLEGIRKISRLEDFSQLLPAENDLVLRQVPPYSSQLGLRPTEIYIWNLLPTPKTFGQLLEESWLGPTETKKIILGLKCLRLVDFNQNSPEASDSSRATVVDLGKSLTSFNEKSSFIHKYMAKQLGPVAFNLIKKCYLEIQEYLDPIFLNLELESDGHFEPRAMLRFSLNELGSKEKKALLRGFDEILAAELFLVKKNLGNQQEEFLAASLKKIGEPQ